jgi:hypothetical protein
MGIRFGKSVIATALALACSGALAQVHTNDCEFSIAAAGSAVDSSGESFRARIGWEEGDTGYMAGCAIANLFFDTPVCQEFFRNSATGEDCLNMEDWYDDPANEARIIQLSLDYAWQMQEGADPYNAMTWNYASPVPPPWLLMTGQQWDQFREGRGDQRGGLGIDFDPR